jgi:drug/metabolite transporter (DMT)-like permease
MELPKVSSAKTTPAMAAESGAALRKLLVQGVFLFTGVLSTCVAQFVFYQGAGDQKAMLLPLCNYLGMMLVGLLPAVGATAAVQKKQQKEKTEKCHEKKPQSPKKQPQRSPEDDVEPELTPLQTTDRLTPSKRRSIDLEAVDMELTRRAAVADEDNQKEEEVSDVDDSSDDEKKPALGFRVTPSSVSFSLSTVQLCIVVSVVLDFAGCIFSNVGLSMAGSGLYQVVYSSVICWSALMSRFILKKVVTKEEWFGIALVTFGLAFSALGESGSGRDNTAVLMGCFHTLVGAAFYGGNYVTGEYTLKLAERPHPKELCLKIGAACVAIIAIYQSIFVLPEWDALVTKPIVEATGNTTHIVAALVVYTLSQLAHGLTYFVMLGSSGAVTTGIMQSLRAVCVFVISSMLYCSRQESQCFDTKRGVATLIVVSGVMFYSWAKSQQGKASVLAPPSSLRRPKKDPKSKMVAGKNYVV